jgi:hypothetical protein
MGRVTMNDNELRRFMRKVSKDGPVIRAELGPCWVWTASTTKYGYGQMHVMRNGVHTMMTAHRLSYGHWAGPIPEGMEIMHRCDHAPCWRPEHLALGTHAQNMADMSAKGRAPRGNHHRWTKLPDECVDEIREMVAFGCLQHDVAGLFGVSQSLVSRIASGVHRRRVANG